MILNIYRAVDLYEQEHSGLNGRDTELLTHKLFKEKEQEIDWAIKLLDY